MNETISIIIKTWNRKEVLLHTLEILSKLRYSPLEIIVVDNNSTDDTVSSVKKCYPNVKLIELKNNIGIEATNIGLSHSSGEYIFLLDNDSYPEYDYLEDAIGEFKNNKKLGIMALKIDENLGNEKANYHRKEMNGVKCKRFVGCGVIIKRELINNVGGYDGKFFMWGEESDLSFRALNFGYEIMFYPKYVVYHLKSKISRPYSTKMYYETRNIIWLYWKYSNPLSAALKTSYSFIVLGYRAIKSRNTAPFVKGYMDGLREIPSIVKRDNSIEQCS